MYYASNRDDSTVVSFNGFFSNGGVWACQKHRSAVSCAHIVAAEKLGVHKELLWAAEVAETEDPAPDRERAAMREHGEHQLSLHMLTVLQIPSADYRSIQEANDERSISYIRVGPPEWCRLQTDTTHTVKTRKDLPPVLPLGDDPRCRCGAPPKLDVPIKTMQCIVYDVETAIALRIEVRACSVCATDKRQYAGPDLSEYGLFNFNNSRVYTHALLNDYTSTYSAHSAAFHAYRTVVTRRYTTSGCNIEFVGNIAFRAAWYSFSCIQDIIDTHTCEICGPNPDVVIFDGTTSGSFAKDRVTSTLRPPTYVTESSLRRKPLVIGNRSMAAVEHKVAKAAREAIRWRMQLMPSGSSRLAGIEEDDTKDDAADADADRGNGQAAKQQAKRVSKRNAHDEKMRASLPKITADLEAAGLPDSLVALFSAIVVPVMDPDLEEVRLAYMELLVQVRAPF